MAPLIGITVSADPGPVGNLRPGLKLYYLSQRYARAVEKSGGIPVMLPILRTAHIAEGLLQAIDGLLVTGGIRPLPKYMEERISRGESLSLVEQDPGRNHWDTYLVEQALKRDMPVLAICRGAQVLGSVLGCTLESCHRGSNPDLLEHRQELPPDQPSHFIEIDPRSRLGAITKVESVAVNSFHHQAIARISAPGVRISARAEDGVVEGIESTRHHFALGVQFHPERMTDRAPWRRLFSALRDAAIEYGRSHRYRIRYEMPEPPETPEGDPEVGP